MGARDTPSRWRLILAGGNWTRLRSLTLQIAGDERLKQFCPVLSSATLCEDTQRRGALLPKTPSSGRACGPTYGVLVMSVWHGLSVITHLKPLHTARVEAAVAVPLWSALLCPPPGLADPENLLTEATFTELPGKEKKEAHDSLD